LEKWATPYYASPLLLLVTYDPAIRQYKHAVGALKALASDARKTVRAIFPQMREEIWTNVRCRE
jgi:hypothetical protein